MNRQGYLKLIVGFSLMLSGVVRAGSPNEKLQLKANQSIKVAEEVVVNVRKRLDASKKLLNQISPQSSEYKQLESVTAQAKKSWQESLATLNRAKKFAGRISSVSKKLAKDFTLLTITSAGIATANAKTVEMCLDYVEASAKKNKKGVVIIKKVIADSLQDIADAKTNYEQAKKLIVKGKSK